MKIKRMKQNDAENMFVSSNCCGLTILTHDWMCKISGLENRQKSCNLYFKLVSYSLNYKAIKPTDIQWMQMSWTLCWWIP